MLPNQPVIILVEPQLAENVGMTARAMMNCGLYHLRLLIPGKTICLPRQSPHLPEQTKFSATPKFMPRLKPLLPTCSRYMRPRPAVAI